MAPIPGTSNNPSGENGLYEHLGSVVGGILVEAPYGSLKRFEQSTRAAPIAQPGVFAPKRAQRASQRKPRSTRPSAPTPIRASALTAPRPSMQPTYAATLAARWQAIAAIPGASDEVKEYAARAWAALNR